MKKFIPCRKCNHKPSDRVPIGFYEDIIEKNGQTYKVLIECEHHKEWQREYNSYQLFKKNGFDEKTWDYDFSSYVGIKSKSNIVRFEKFINNFDNTDVRSSILYFCGNHGTQKTTIANIIGKKLLLNGHDVHYITMNKFKDSFWAYVNARDRDTKREQENDYIKIKNFEKIKNSDLLILDDAFVVNLFPGGLVDIDDFIRTRVKENKGMIIISNFNLKELDDIKTCSKAIKSFIQRETDKRNSVFLFEDIRHDIPMELF
jgi:DNA replication protein DnaC